MALTTLANVKEYLGVSSADNDALFSSLITRVQSLIETYCERTFDSTAYTSWLDGSGQDFLWLPQWPVTALSRVAIGRRSVGSLIHNNSSAYSVVAQNTGSTFTVTEHLKAGTDNTATDTVEATVSIATLVADLEGDVSSLSSSLASDLQDYPSTELEVFYGREMINGSLDLQIPDENAQDYRVDFTEGYLYRSGGWPSGTDNVYVAYTAGYSSIPGALEQIAIDFIKDVYNAASKDSAVLQEKIGDYSYNLGFNKEIRDIFVRHQSKLDYWKRMVYA